MSQQQKQYTQAMRQGLALNLEGDFMRAMRAFRVAIRTFPQEAAPYAGLGEACFGAGQLDRALECFKLAARYANGDIRYLVRVADIQERLGQLLPASQTYMAAGEFMLRRRNLAEAITFWERAVRLQPNLLGAHQRLAMVFQRQRETKRAVREYLAIARILQQRGEREKALRMCEAALRLDPGSEDAQTAMDLVRYGEAAFERDLEPESEPEEPPAGEPRLADAVRQMTEILAAEQAQRPQPAERQLEDEIGRARRLAQEHLAEEIFRDETDADALYGRRDGGLSKLERDALIGQGIDFESRHQRPEAISCYRQAIDGGLNLPAAFFTLGMLYLEEKDADEARRYLRLAAIAPAFRRASEAAAARLRSDR